MVAGVRVIDKGWKRISQDLKKAHGSSVKVGYPEEKKAQHDSGVDIATLAIIHEYGAPSKGIPARPFMAQSYDKNKGKINDLIEKEYEDILKGKTKVNKSLQKIGVFVKGSIQGFFRSGKFSPLKPQTIKRKGSSKPLIDSGQLRQSVDFEIVENEK